MPKSTCVVADCVKLRFRERRCYSHYTKALASGECAADPCAWPDCDLFGITRGFCSTHLARSRVVGHTAAPWVAWDARMAERERVRANQVCVWPNCERSLIHGNGMCKSHQQRAKLIGTFDEPWKKWRPGGNCIICGKWADGPKRGQRYCSQSCNLIGWKRDNAERVRELGREHQRRRRAQKLATQVEKFTDKDIRMAHGDVCYLCNENINFRLKFPHPKSRSVDHVIPLSRGGSHTLGNVAMTHYQCNQIKSAKDATSAPTPTLFAL